MVICSKLTVFKKRNDLKVNDEWKVKANKRINWKDIKRKRRIAWKTSAKFEGILRSKKEHLTAKINRKKLNIKKNEGIISPSPSKINRKQQKKDIRFWNPTKRKNKIKILLLEKIIKNIT